MTKKRKINIINDITGIQNLMRKLVDDINTFRSGISQNILIKIYGKEDITY